MNDYTEDALVEQPAIELFKQLKWDAANCYDETFPNSFLGRATSAEVVLVARLRAALEKLNDGLPPDAINAAIEELTRDRSTLTPVAANRDVYQLLKNGIKVSVRGDDEQETTETVRVIDWDDHTNNDYFLASQLWVVSL